MSEADPYGIMRVAKRGAKSAIYLSFPAAALMALVHRFPMPFSGWFGGIEAVLPSLIAVLFYGVFCFGFLFVGGLGAVVGLAVTYWFPGLTERETSARLHGTNFLFDLLIALVLANSHF